MTPTYEPERDFYKLLGLTPTTASSEQVIRQAYLKCARKAHPDRDRDNQAATKIFQDIQEAYETLKDPAKKTKYDKSIAEWTRREETRKREEAKKRDDEAWARSRTRRRAGPAPFGQFGQEKYFPYEARAPKPSTTSKPPMGAATAWQEMKRGKTGKFGQSTSQSQKPAANSSTKQGPHPTSKTPRKPASQRQGSFAQWAKEHPPSPTTPGKDGYRPGSSTVGDEPQAKTNSYSSAKKTAPFEADDSCESDSDNVESILKSRPSQPYQKVYGEKTRLFEEQPRSSEDESRGRKQAKTPETPRKDAPSGGSCSSPSRGEGRGPNFTQETNSFWPHPETTPEFSGEKRTESAKPQGEYPAFERKPTESPGPWFTKEVPQGAFAFTAGSEASADAPPVRKTRSSSNLGRKNTASPTKKLRPQTTDSSNSSAPAPESPAFKFDPKEWTESFGPQTFIPRTTQRSPVSPSGKQRSPLKRSATTGTSSSNTPRPASVADDTSGEDGGAGLKSDPPKSAGAAYVPSPNAMDIDSPPQRPSTGPTPTRASSTRTRAVPVEPSKPEWRAGTGAEQSKEMPKNTTVPPLKPTTGGSEDTEEFRTKLGDLKNVPPFVPQGGGLGSFGDMKSSLPFTSQPSENIPLKRPEAQPHTPLKIPTVPKAPRFPSVPGIRPTAETVQSYVRYFERYLTSWNEWNGRMVDHFWERKNIMNKEERGGEITASKRRVRERLAVGRLDGEVRKTWVEECEKHQRHLEEYLEVLERYGHVWGQSLAG